VLEKRKTKAQELLKKAEKVLNHAKQMLNKEKKKWQMTRLFEALPYSAMLRYYRDKADTDVSD